MGRHINPLLKLLLNDKEAKKDFIELVQNHGDKWTTSKYLEDGKFRNTKWFVSGQTIGNIMKRLGFVGRRGKPARKPESIVKEQNRWMYGDPGCN
jgi:hypothetical protein